MDESVGKYNKEIENAWTVSHFLPRLLFAPVHQISAWALGQSVGLWKRPGRVVASLQGLGKSLYFQSSNETDGCVVQDHENLKTTGRYKSDMLPDFSIKIRTRLPTHLKWVLIPLINISPNSG